MESLIPKLFILTIEASVVFAIIIGIMIFMHKKGKKNDKNAVTQVVRDIVENDAFRLKGLSSKLKKIDFQGDSEEKAKELHQKEKAFLNEILNIYLKRDVIRLDNIQSTLLELTEQFIVPSASSSEVSPSQSTSDSDATPAESSSEVNEKIQREVNDLRLKNTELNEHLFEALETMTNLVSEHSKAQGGAEKPSSQQILDAIVLLRNQRKDSGTTKPAPVTPPEAVKPVEVEEKEDETLFTESTPDLGISEILKTDLETDLSKEEPKEEEDDPWAAALAEQSDAESKTDESEEDDDPWAAALSEQSEAESKTDEPEEDDDPWASALAEQSEAESKTDEPEEDDDPWASALAEQSEAESKSEEPEEDDDPWAAALAEQSEAESKTEEPEEDDDPWAAALAEQSKAEDKGEGSEEDDDPWAAALAEQQNAEDNVLEEDDPWAAALAEQDEAEKKQ